MTWYTKIIICLILVGIVIVFLHQGPTFISSSKVQDQYLVKLLLSTTTPQLFSIDHVVDGDTFVVQVNHGLATVRLIGMNSPEVVDPRKPVQCFGLEASAEAHRLLDHQSVYLVADSTQDSLDKYNRVLAYATLPDNQSFAETMIKKGFAYEYTFKKAYSQQKLFRAAELDAKKNARGLWSPSTCNGKLQK